MSNRFGSINRAAAFALPLLIGVLAGQDAKAMANRPVESAPAEESTGNRNAGEVALKIYEIGKAGYDHYQTAEAARHAISLEAPNRVEVTPTILKVTENASNRLPGVEATAGVAWVPYAGLETNLFWEFLVGSGKGGQGCMSKKGVPTEDEWNQWYSHKGAYPGAGGDDPPLTNDRLKITFDAQAPGEAFEEGLNTVRVKVWGFTRIFKNMWWPPNWFSTPTEVAAFPAVISQTRDVEVQLPYYVWKNPNLDSVTQNHQANLTVQLWDRNLARESVGGNEQHYEDPRVRVLCENGSIPPDNGTSNNERMICSDTRIHQGTHPPELVHVTPDFDPISVLVKHQVWDLLENRGKVYNRSLLLRPTRLFCLQPGVPDTVPPTPPDSTPPPPPPEKVYTPWRTVRTPEPLVIDPDSGPQRVAGSIEVELVSMSLGSPPETLRATGDAGDWICPNCAQSGDNIELRYHVRDIFGRHFRGLLAASVPEPEDVAAGDTLELAQPVLNIASREQQPHAMQAVEVVLLDLGGLPWGERRPVSGIMVLDPMNQRQYMSDATGIVMHQVPHGQRFQLIVQDPQTRYLPLQTPPSPAVLKPLQILDAPLEELGFTDDRLYVWLSPGFTANRLALGAGSILVRPGAHRVRIGAVSDLDPTTIHEAEWRFSDGTPVGPAVVRAWGETDARGLGYVPALFRLEATDLNEQQIARLISEEIVRLRVVAGSAEHYLDIPLEVETASGVDNTHPLRGELALLSPQPNPTTGTIDLQFAIPTEGRVRLEIYDLRGRRVATLRDGWEAAGLHRAVWTEGQDLPSGVYFARLELDGASRTRRIILTR